MDTTLIINISVAVVVVLGILFLYNASRKPAGSKGKLGGKHGAKSKPKEPNYEAFFIMGISFLPLGLIFTAAIGNPGFLGLTGLGVIYIAIGLSNLNKGKMKLNGAPNMTRPRNIGGAKATQVAVKAKTKSIKKKTKKPAK